jgi:hypothetical protein
MAGIDSSAAFTKAMHSFTSGRAEEVARVVDASTAKLAVDIGGASGTLVHSLLLANSQYCGLLKDAGLRFSKSTPISSQIAIIEAVAA